MNILFIMYDQLRFDYLSCAGHPHLETPNFDRVAARGVRFTNAYAQSPLCGPSRMSAYTGRYVSSHGASWNVFPLKVGEMTMGDHLREAGMDCWILGKTHHYPDTKGMARLGITTDTIAGARLAQCGFDNWARDDGLWATGPDGDYDKKPSPYQDYLRAKGYDTDHPWADFANAGIDAAGNKASGWFMANATKPANIQEEDSETPWLTGEAIRFIDQAKGPWCAHVSYIKPHWPYIAPAPYNDMYRADQVSQPQRDPSERDDPHPVFGAYMDNRIAQAFQNDENRTRVIQAYMGLVKQCDDQLGRLLDHLEATGRMEDTMIVLTSDHGDYLGDHWLGEKDLFHDPSVKIPMIISDPRAAADATRGSVCDALVELIDLVPTFVEAAGGEVADHILEGRALTPWLHGESPAWRDCVISEFDYGATPQAVKLGVAPKDARLFMVFDGRYKLIHAEGGFRPMLFDLAADPLELTDLAKTSGHEGQIARLYDLLGQWSRRCGQRATMSDADINALRGKSLRKGILPFLVDGSEVPEDLTEAYRGPAPKWNASDR
ncbi:MAG: sulfatase-like hydrolase/transferase [Rhodobacteraceae bacterium]|nr:sulfatase-like hydrolase/transferase [Paracoccaceae bacterium]